MAKYSGGGTLLSIDVSDVTAKMTQLKLVMKEERWKMMMSRVFSNTGRKVKAIMKKDIPLEYNAKKNWIGKQILQPRKDGSPLSCVIPVRGSMGVGGAVFPITGGTRKQRRKMKIKTLRGTYSSLPDKMPARLGGNPPFQAKGIALTRKTNQAYPLIRVVGLGVPQMPVNRSEDEVQKDIVDYMAKELERQFRVMMAMK